MFLIASSVAKLFSKPSATPPSASAGLVFESTTCSITTSKITVPVTSLTLVGRLDGIPDGVKDGVTDGVKDGVDDAVKDGVPVGPS